MLYKQVMATICFSLSSKDVGNGVHEILVRFYHGRKINQRAKSGIFINSTYWDNATQQVISPKFRMMTVEQKEIVRYLSMVQNDIQKLQTTITEAFIKAGSGKIRLSDKWLSDVVSEAMNNRLNISEPQTESFFEAFDRFIDSRQVSELRKKMLRVVRNMVSRYEQVRRQLNPRFTITFDKIDNNLLSDFEHFLRNEYQYINVYPKIYKDLKGRDIPKERGQNTISNRMAILRTFIMWALDEELMEDNPFRKYSLKSSVYGTPIYITIEERNQLLRSAMPSKRLETVRDIFVFQCLVGCRVGDLLRLNRSNIVNGAIEYIPHKTKEGSPVTLRVPLNETASDLLSKYDDEERESLFPFISAQKYNDYIKECFKIAGLDRYVTVLNNKTREPEQKHLYEVASSHMARRTFVGNLYKQVKDPNLVGALSGHKDGSKAFARYRDIDEEMKTDLVKLLE